MGIAIPALTWAILVGGEQPRWIVARIEICLFAGKPNLASMGIMAVIASARGVLTSSGRTCNMFSCITIPSTGGTYSSLFFILPTLLAPLQCRGYRVDDPSPYRLASKNKPYDSAKDSAFGSFHVRSTFHEDDTDEESLQDSQAVGKVVELEAGHDVDIQHVSHEDRPKETNKKPCFPKDRK